jgi:hypothetical protein
MTIEEQWDAFEQRVRDAQGLYEASLFKPVEFRGCSPEEIMALERKYDVILPIAYRLFLSRLGHNTHGFAAGSLLAYKDVLAMTEKERQKLAQWQEECPDFEVLPLPENALIVLTHNDGEWCGFIFCEGQEDSPVFIYGPEHEFEEDKAQERYHSFMGMLNCFLDEDIVSFHDDTHKHGTKANL